jgi:hypothetical protein
MGTARKRATNRRDTLGPTKRPVGARSDPVEVVPLNRMGKLDIDYLDVSVDASFGSITDTASDVAITVIGGKGPKRYIFHDDTKVRTFLETVSDIAAVITDWSPRFAGVIGVLVEKKRTAPP